MLPEEGAAPDEGLGSVGNDDALGAAASEDLEAPDDALGTAASEDLQANDDALETEDLEELQDFDPSEVYSIDDFIVED
ncbi:hypothetical protein E2562_038674 [Oryza meyeriana var. granulata]|uniref:Uncharacterized protein n=1 Tax=Oryza meyeriana var. granulata TaxID=110450 RepID=A0A6G1F292_9ORYZ|nr:hypothetical protein E2562_038674 [Oryza meyeriana var. granulata]